MGQPGGDSSTTLLIANQRRRWRLGDRVRVEQLLAERPDLAGDADALLDLIYGEVLLRREAGERPDVAEYLARFPTLADPIRLQFEVDEVLGPTQFGDESAPTDPVGRLLAPPPPAPPGYEILSELGRGGMGVVYLARQVKLDRLVALKMIRAGELADPAERARFDAEAQTVARLSHPNVVHVYEVGEHQGQPFLALEYVPGGTLADALKGPPFAPTAAAALIAALARAVQHAHDAGVVHRDLKPANVLLPAETPVADGPVRIDWPVVVGQSASRLKVADFGLAKRLDSDGLTRTGDFMGTPNYAAPEQAAGRTVGPAADVWALGAILYQMLTGRPPFAGGNQLETLDQVRFADPVPPGRLRPNLPRDLETVCLKCLRKDPGHRYPSADALADDLDRFVNGQPVRARPIGTVERVGKWARRRPAVAGLLGALVLLTAAALVTVTSLWRRESVARDGERHQREQAEVRSAELLIANARMAWLTGDFDQARRALGEVPHAHRTADWRYFTRVTAPPLMETLVDGETIRRLTYSPDGRRLAAFTNHGRVCVWDPATGREVMPHPNLDGTPLDLAFTHDGRLIVATYGVLPPAGNVPKGHTDVVVLDPATGGLLDAWTRPERARGFSLAPGGRHATFVSFESSTVYVLDAATGRELYHLDGFSAAGTPYLAFSPNGALLAAQGYRQDVRVVTTATGVEVRKLVLNDDEREQVLFSLHPDGARFGMRLHRPTENSFILLRSAIPGVPTITLGRLYASLAALVFSPDGRRMAGFGSAERFASVWDADTGNEVLSLRGHNDRLTSFAFSPDSRHLAVGCLNGRVAVWDLGD